MTPPEADEDLICRVCASKADKSCFFAREMMFGFRDKFRYLICGNCGCFQLVDDVQDMARYYPREFYAHSELNSPAQFGLGFQLRRFRSLVLLGKFGPLVRAIAFSRPRPAFFNWIRQLPLALDSPVLDIGCGNGALLRDMAANGFTNLTGVDPFISAPLEYDDGVRVLRSTLESLSGDFELVMMHHSFEHLPQPGEALMHVARLLRAGGAAIVRIPVAGKEAWRRYGPDWVQIDAPRHHFLHTERSLEILAGRAGLRISAVTFDSTEFQFWGSEQYRRDIPLFDERSFARNPASLLFSRQEVEEFAREAGRLNAAREGDQACFTLSKA